VLQYYHFISDEDTRKGIASNHYTRLKIYLVKEILNLPLSDVPREIAHINGAAVAPAHRVCGYRR
jgi:hypothetical protein